MKAPDKVKRLIEVFDRNLAAYKSSGYKEANVRSEFIDPFFEALEWDVYNKQGYAEAYKDVITEDAIKIGGVTKAPDYCFRIGGARKFFVEAKKPSVDIKSDISPAYQLRRYAWSAGLPLSILTDFEEFAVYDCRIRPQLKDKSGKARVIYLTFRDYIDKWEEISSIFSKKAVLEGFFDKYVESKKKRSTQEVDAEFLKEIENWRLLLARNIALRNSALGTREINFAVQRTIDRIIFLRICEDRGIESYGQLQALLNGANIYERLRKIFRSADEKYNSGLFHFHREKDLVTPPDELTLGIKIDDRVLKEIFKQLYYPDSPYEFSVLGAEILGHIYEQFLGKVITLTKGHQAKVEEKPEVRKAGGVYYTPTYIVDYIVKNTVGKLCEKKTPKQIEKLRILDPACGSGSFLIGAYNYLNAYHRDWYLENLIPQLGHEGYISKTALRKYVPGKKPEMPIYQGKGAQWYLTTREKKRILLNNIYGVDIDSQAVEVTKLSLLLKVLENENQDTLEKQMKLWRERALPDLGNNIKCGNSLIGPDFYEGQQLTLLDDEAQYRINVFDWNAEFPEIMEKGGFDSVIGNPPYGVLNKDNHSAQELSYLNVYAVAQYKTDLFHLFIQRGIELLKIGGLFGYIVPNPWLTLKFTAKLRKYILHECKINEIVVFDYLVFQAANVYTSLVFLEKASVDQTNLIAVKNVSEAVDSKKIEETKIANVLQSTWEENEGGQFETRLVGEIGEIVLILLSKWAPLSHVARASLGCQAYNRSKHTPEQIKNRVFHSASKLSEEYLPELAGKDVGRYCIERQRGEWIKYGSWLHDYRTMDWLQGPRILVREIPGRPPYRIQACYVEDIYCNYKTILNVNPSESTTFSMKYLCGLLNSRLLSFLFPYMSNKIIAQSFPRLSVGDLKKLPIRAIDYSRSPDKAHHDKMVFLVEQMLDLNKQLAKAKTPDENTRLERQIKATDNQIDQLVYELYGLTEKEIKIVEKSQ